MGRAQPLRTAYTCVSSQVSEQRQGRQRAVPSGLSNLHCNAYARARWVAYSTEAPERRLHTVHRIIESGWVQLPIHPGTALLPERKRPGQK